jgi:hypothetical protein
VGVRNAERLDGARLNIIETLRAAAPWQRLRDRDPDGGARDGLRLGVAIRRQDFRVTRASSSAPKQRAFSWSMRHGSLRRGRGDRAHRKLGRQDPRLKPPFPTQCGLYGCPTIVNNVETIAVVGTILRRASQWFANLGRPNNSGNKIYCVSGHVNAPCNVEEALGVTFRELVDRHRGGACGGWDNLLAVIPGGATTPLIPARDIIDAPLDFDTMQSLKSALGTGGLLVFHKSTDLVRAIARISRFYMHESCGQCTPCREGAG